MSKKKNFSLIFGCSGQDGSLLSRSLLKQNYEVVGTSRAMKADRSIVLKNHKLLGIDKDIRIQSCNLNCFDEVANLITKVKPDEIYNLAAQSSVGKSYKNPQETFSSIIDISLNILEVCKAINYDGNLFFAGSSEIFGNTETKAKLEHKQQPLSPYGIAKQTSFNLVKTYRELHDLKCVTGILFNHESPLRDRDFVTQKIISEALLCTKDKSHKLKLGNISVKRDWGWAEEYIQAIQLINRSKIKKDHIVCTGKLNSLETFVKIVFQELNLNWKDHVTFDSELLRKGEIEKSFGDPYQIKCDLNWEAKFNLNNIIKELIRFKVKFL